MAVKHIFYSGNGNRTGSVEFNLIPDVGVIYGVTESGDLRRYQFNGTATGSFESYSGQVIGNGWENFRHVLGCGDGVILAIKPNGDLLWYRYSFDATAQRHVWDANSGHQIGNGWQNFLHVFVQPSGSGHGHYYPTIYAIQQNGDLLWYSYNGSGENDPTGTQGWHPNSGHQIGNGW